MPYRYLVKHLVSRALGSYMASGLRSLSQDAFWERLEAGKYLSHEQMAQIRRDVEASLGEAEARGKNERELIEELLKEILVRIIRSKDEK